MTKKVIVVDDEEMLLEIYKVVLTGFDIVTFENGEKAWKFFQENKEDVGFIISDYMMPCMNGVSLLHEVRKTSDIPFLLCTGSAMDTELETIKNTNCMLMNKPFDFDDIANVVSNFI